DSTLAERLEAAREQITRVKNVPTLVFSGWAVECWYWSPFPERYHGRKLYVCDFTLRYTARRARMVAHAAAHKAAGLPRHPPGRRVYDDTANGIALWEVDGRTARLYCQALCLISKLFLDHKTLYYDVDPFLFYVLTGANADGDHHVLGYFSKEKQSPDEYNLACILTFPQYQRQGYGTLLISLSYELTVLEGKHGSPEKPLSDLGKLSYKAYWSWTLLNALRNADGRVSVEDVAKARGLKLEDAISTLSQLNLLRQWKGQYVVRRIFPTRG
ncbi:acyl-CoA N-acyltransferase, partial [Pelagophyceae sp. CCMP2097]